MIIRLETPADYRAVEELTREAFWNVYRPGCTEHFVLHRYRSNPDFLPELSLVMANDDGPDHYRFSRPDDGTIADYTYRESQPFGYTDNSFSLKYTSANAAGRVLQVELNPFHKLSQLHAAGIDRKGTENRSCIPHHEIQPLVAFVAVQLYYFRRAWIASLSAS